MAVDVSKLKKNQIEFDEFKMEFKKSSKLQKANASTLGQLLKQMYN